MRKSQLYGQIFIYLLTILIIAFILIYGYNAISSFKCRTEQVVSLKLSQDLKSSVERITPDFGSVIKKEIDIGSASEICFVESYRSFNPSFAVSNSDGTLVAADPIIKDSIQSGSDKNIFLIEKSTTNSCKSIPNSFYGGKISVDSSSSVTFNVLCIKSVNGIAILKLTGKGDHALVEKWA